MLYFTKTPWTKKNFPYHHSLEWNLKKNWNQLLQKKSTIIFIGFDGANKKAYDHTWWNSILGPVGGSEVGAGAKKRRKNFYSNIQSGVRKMIA